MLAPRLSPVSVMGPNDPIDQRAWHRRYWDTYNRPYPGCGCLWAIVVVLFIWWILSWAFGWGWGWWGTGTTPR